MVGGGESTSVHEMTNEVRNGSRYEVLMKNGDVGYTSFLSLQ